MPLIRARPPNEDGRSARFGAVILAAGGSSRLGRPKQLVRFGGETLLARTIDATLAAGCRPVVVVVGRDGDACVAAAGGRPVHWARNADWARGMGTSIRLGVRTLGDGVDRAVLLLCDQPGVTADTIRRLDHGTRASGKAVAVAAYAGTIGPPVVVGGDYLRRLLDWPDDHGAKPLWAAHPEAVHRVDCPEAAADVDTAADYERLVGGDATRDEGRPQ